MKLEKAKHTITVLRVTLGMTQKWMSDLIGVSINLVQSIETNRLRLTEKLAERVSHETGVNPLWLLANNVSVPPKDRHGKPYTLKTFENTQVKNKRPMAGLYDIPTINWFMCEQIAEIVSALLQAYRDDKFPLFQHRLTTVIKELYEFGYHPIDMMEMRRIKEDYYNKDSLSSDGALVDIMKFYHSRLSVEFYKKLEKHPEQKQKYLKQMEFLKEYSEEFPNNGFPMPPA